MAGIPIKLSFHPEYLTSYKVMQRLGVSWSHTKTSTGFSSLDLTKLDLKLRKKLFAIIGRFLPLKWVEKTAVLCGKTPISKKPFMKISLEFS